MHVYIGIKTPNKDTYWYSQGIFAFNQNGFSYNASEHNISISCVDLVALLDGSLAGTLVGYKTVVSTGEPIQQAIIDTYKLSGMKDCVVKYWNRNIPYDIEFSADTTIWSILTELRDLYYPFEMWFNGTTFTCQEIPSGFDDPVILDSETLSNLIISESCDVDYSEIKNCVEVFGASVEYDQFVDEDKMKVTSKNDETQIVLTTTALEDTNDCTVSFVVPSSGFHSSVSVTIKNTITNDDATTSVFTHGPYTLYESDVDENGSDIPMDGALIPHDTMVVVKYSPSMKAFYYRGEQQQHAIAILVDRPRTDTEIAQAKADEACNNIKFICLQDDSTRYISYTNPKFTIEKIGRRNKVCTGSAYEVYTTNESTMQCAEYELWKSCRLTDNVKLECLLVPWLDVNQKLSYVPHYINTNGEELEYLIKQINISLGEGTMTLTMSRYYPYYPYIVKNKN